MSWFCSVVKMISTNRTCRVWYAQVEWLDHYFEALS